MGIMRQNAMTTVATVPGCPVDESFDPRYPRLRLAPTQHLTFYPNISFRGL
jgi:hypothetical protein